MGSIRKGYYSGGYHKHTELVCLQVGGRADFTQVGLGGEVSINYYSKPIDFYITFTVLFFSATFSLQLGKDNYDYEEDEDDVLPSTSQ